VHGTRTLTECNTPSPANSSNSRRDSVS
jgi:hypothetical protein